jgi:hypothetical protein
VSPSTVRLPDPFRSSLGAIRGRWIRRPSYVWYARRRRPAQTIEPATELVIEGFPRSANTFSVFAFQLAQPRPVRLAHHLHAPAHVRTGVRMGKPVIVLIRSPQDAVLSLVLRDPHVAIGRALNDYSVFYEEVGLVRDRCVVAPFEDVVTNYGAIIRRVNERFATDFAAFDPTPANVAECYSLIEEKSVRPSWGPTIHAYVSGLIPRHELEAARRRASSSVAPPSEDRVARPSEFRRAQKERLRAAYDQPQLARRRERAEAAYVAFADCAPLPNTFVSR